MPTVEIRRWGDSDVLFVRCHEPMTKQVAPDRPYDRKLLEAAVAVSPGAPGASLEQVDYEHIPHPADFDSRGPASPLRGGLTPKI